MAYLTNPTYMRAVLEAHGFSFQKKYGQNFLVDANVLEKIIDSANITKEDFVLEIGPGMGTMTQRLCETAKEVVAVEIDKNLLPVLEDTLSTYKNVTVINNDILKMDLKALAEEHNGGKPIKIVANLPYYITTPIIMGLFEAKVPMESITIMVQKEVADRMQQGPGSKDYGALSLAVQYYSKPEVICEVSPTCFIPQPKVASTVIKLTSIEPLVEVDEEFLFRVIRASFNQRRKTLQNGLSNSGFFNCSKEDVAEAIKEAGFEPSIRGEKLSLEEFALLSNKLQKKCK